MHDPGGVIVGSSGGSPKALVLPVRYRIQPVRYRVQPVRTAENPMQSFRPSHIDSVQLKASF